MNLRNLIPWRRGGRDVPVRQSESPVRALQHEVDRLFERFWRDVESPFSMLADDASGFTPRVDVEETDERIVVRADLPGMDEQDVAVSLEHGALCLRGERRHEVDHGAGGARWTERAYGAFERAIQLPDEIEADKVSAKYRHGVLTVTIPKSGDARRRPHRIAITAS